MMKKIVAVTALVALSGPLAAQELQEGIELIPGDMYVAPPAEFANGESVSPYELLQGLESWDDLILEQSYGGPEQWQLEAMYGWALDAGHSPEMAQELVQGQVAADEALGNNFNQLEQWMQYADKKNIGPDQ